jgi:nicotinamidase/pyrazinamidase
VGLAYDYCVGWSAVDARRCGFGAVVIRDGCRAIDLGGTVARMEADFRESGVVVISSEEF